MRIKAIIIFYFFLFLALEVQAQFNYMIGSSNVSIKPDNSVLSVALADYADPRDGKFRITWKYIRENKAITALTGLGDKICTTKSNGLLIKNPGDDVLQRKVIGRADRIIALTTPKSKFFGHCYEKINLLTGNTRRGGEKKYK